MRRTRAGPNKPEKRCRLGSVRVNTRLRFQDLRLCGTGLSREEKVDLKVFAKQLGAKVVSKWDQRCTHLVTPASFNIVTEKLVLAVADAVGDHQSSLLGITRAGMFSGRFHQGWITQVT